MTSFDLIFDNGGSITLQTENYCHVYQDAKQAARDVSDIMEPGTEPGNWEGNEPECRFEYDSETEKNGGYVWVTDNDIFAAVGEIQKEERENFLESISGKAQQDFMEVLFDLRDNAAQQQ